MMSRRELSVRDNWQTVNELKAAKAEKRFYVIMKLLFENTEYVIRERPKELRNIYGDVKLEEEVEKEIYNPSKGWTHGIVPDYAIDNKNTKKTLYVEVKRQDGWVENKSPSAGRGNAHERCCKYHTPGLLKIMRETGGHANSVLPFLIVFQGDITRDPKRVREITYWFNGYKDNFFMWRDTKNPQPLVRHFNKIRNLLD